MGVAATNWWDDPQLGRPVPAEDKWWDDPNLAQHEQPPSQQRSAGQEVMRKTELASRGFTDRALETIGGIPDAISAGLRLGGIETSRPGFYTDNLKAGYNALAGGMTQGLNAMIPGATQGIMGGPMSTADKAAQGIGSGLADAASMAIPAGMAARALPAGGVGQGIAQALAAQPVTQAVAGAAGGGVGAATDSPVAGLAAALAVPLGGAAMGRAITPVRSLPTPEQARLIGVADAEGIPLSAGQRTQSRPLQTIESTFGSLPMTSGAERAASQTQRSAFNRSVLERAGIGAESATPDVLDAGRNRLGAEFQRLSQGLTVNLDNQFLGDLQGVANQYGNKLPSQQREVFGNYVNDVLNVGNAMPGPQYQVTRSDLTKQYKAIANSDPTLSRALRGLRDSLDEAANRSQPAANADDWRTARREYANLQSINRAMGSGTPDAVSGNIPPAQLSMAVRQSNPREFAYGGGELNDLARVGQAFVRPQIPNSGTAERTMMQNLMTGTSVGGAGSMMGADPMTALATGAGSLVLPRLAQALYQSGPGQAYMTNQLAAGAGPQINPALVAALLGGQRQALLPSQ